MALIWPKFWGGEVPTRNLPPFYLAGLELPPPAGAGKNLGFPRAANTFSPPAFFSSSADKKGEPDSANETKTSGFKVNFSQPSPPRNISLKELSVSSAFGQIDDEKFDERRKENILKSLCWLRRVENCFSKTKATLNKIRVWHNSASLLALTWVLKEFRQNLHKPLNMTQPIHTKCQEICICLKKTPQQ